MREVDRVAVEETGPKLLQMMENAGRTLPEHVLDLADGDPVVVLADIGIPPMVFGCAGIENDPVFGRSW